MTTWMAILLPYLPVAVTLVITYLVATLVGWSIGRLMHAGNPRVVGAARRLAWVLVWLLGATLALQEVGVSPNVLYLIIALLGVTALVAIREPLENAGAKYFSDIYTPFKVGDTIEVSGRSGKVIEINPVCTVLLSENEQLISIPNTAFINQVVVNTSPQAWKELTIPISISSGIDLAAFESELLRSIGKLRLRLDQRFPPMLTTKTRSPQTTDLVLTVMLRTPEERDAVAVEVNKRLAEVMQQMRAARR